MKKLLFLPFLFSCCAVFSQSAVTNFKLENPSSVSPGKGYSQVAVVDLGNCNMLILSGQIALDKSGNLVGNDIESQSTQVFKNIKSIVEEYGGTMNNVIKFNYFILNTDHLPIIRKVRDQFINTQKPPASTLVQVNKLFRSDLLLEVEATAIIPK